MVNFNGALLAKDSNFFNTTNRAFLFGDALFEDIRVINGQLIFWEDHYFRLMASMRILRMEIPMEFTMEFLEDEIRNTIGSNGLLSKPTLISISVFRNSETNLSPMSNAVSYVISVSELNDPFYMLNDDSYEVELFRDFFVNQDMLSTLDTNNKAAEVVASIFAKENGYNDCLLLNSSKQVVGTIFGSLFLAKDGKLKTPPTVDGAKNNVVRKKLMEIVESLDSYDLEEASISPFELQKADELFVVTTSEGIQPISKYRKKVYKNVVAKDLLGKLNANARLASLK
jgi:branched-chain amino acid aminotransferase